MATTAQIIRGNYIFQKTPGSMQKVTDKLLSILADNHNEIEVTISLSMMNSGTKDLFHNSNLNNSATEFHNLYSSFNINNQKLQ